MRYVFAIFAASFSLCSSAIEQPDYGAFTSLKPTSLVSPKHPGDAPAPVRVFKGELRISGKFSASWAVNQPNFLMMSFFPDALSKERLPFFVGGYSEGSTVDRIGLANPTQALKQVLTPDEFARLMRRETKEVTGHATLLIADYASGVECDRRWYSARAKRAWPGAAMTYLAASNQFVGC